MDSVSVYDAKARFSKLVERAEAGRSTAITKRGRAFATLQPANLQEAPPSIDLAARLRALFPGGPLKGDILDALDEDRSR